MPKKAGARDGGAGLLEREEAADLPDQTHTMRAGRLGLLGPPRHVSTQDLQGDDGVPRDEVLGEEPIELAERPRFPTVPAAGRALEFEKALQRGRHRRGEVRGGRPAGRRHAPTSASERATGRSAARSTFAYSIVVSVETWPSTSPIVLIGHSRREHPRRQGMPEQIQAAAAGPLVEPGAAERGAHDRVQIIGRDEGLEGGAVSDEELAGGGRRPPVAQIRDQRGRAHPGGAVAPGAARFGLPEGDDLRTPLHVLEAELPDVRGAQAVARRQHEHRIVPAPDGGEPDPRGSAGG